MGGSLAIRWVQVSFLSLCFLVPAVALADGTVDLEEEVGGMPVQWSREDVPSVASQESGIESATSEVLQCLPPAQRQDSRMDPEESAGLGVDHHRSERARVVDQLETVPQGRLQRSAFNPPERHHSMRSRGTPYIIIAPPTRIDWMAKAVPNGEPMDLDPKPSGDKIVVFRLESSKRVEDHPMLDEQLFMQDLAAIIPDTLMPCYRRRLLVNANLRGAVVIRSVIDGRGVMVSSAVHIDSLGDPAMLGCVLSRLEDLPVATVAPLEPVRVVFPIYFSIESD